MGHEFIEPAAANQLHRIVDPAIGKKPDVVYRQNAWMLELRDDARLTQHALLRDGIAGGILDDLDGNAAVQIAITRDVNGSHTALPELLDDFVFGSAEVRPVGDLSKVLQGGIRQPRRRCHHRFTPNNRRASLRNSVSLPVVRRNRPSTYRRNSDRAKARKLVTCVTGIENSRARSA